MPAHVIESEMKDLTPAKLLAMKRVWGVSMQAIYERAYRMGKVDAAERVSFYRAMNARGWKKVEPGAEKIPPETPQLARAIGEQLLSTGGLSRDEVAQLTGRRGAVNESVFLPPDRRLRVM